MTKPIKRPVFHHALLKTSRMDEMIEWYARRSSAPRQAFHAPGIAFLSNDGANHRISHGGQSGTSATTPTSATFAGLHHLAFEYATVDDLLDSWQRLRDDFGYEPHVAVHHGMTLSFYYVDPDGNSVELQADAVWRLEQVESLDAHFGRIQGRPHRQVRRAGEDGGSARQRREDEELPARALTPANTSQPRLTTTASNCRRWCPAP